MAIIIKTLKSPWKQWNYKKFIISKLLSFLHSTWLILWFFMILLYTFPSSSEFIKLPGLGASPKSYIQALTENVAVLINHYYNTYLIDSKELLYISKVMIQAFDNWCMIYWSRVNHQVSRKGFGIGWSWVRWRNGLRWLANKAFWGLGYALKLGTECIKKKW